MTMTLVQMADELLAIIEGERPRLNKTEMREYVRDLFAANAAHLTQPAQSVDVADVRLLLECVEDEHGGDHLEADCRHCAAFDRLTAALQEPDRG